MARTQKTNNLSALSAIRYASLPPGRDLIAPVGLKLAVLAVEGWESIKVADEGNVVAFHCAAQGNESRPKYSLGIQPYTL